MAKYLMNVNIYAQVIVEADSEEEALDKTSDEYHVPWDHELDEINVEMLLDDESEKQARRFGAKDACDF